MPKLFTFSVRSGLHLALLTAWLFGTALASQAQTCFMCNDSSESPREEQERLARMERVFHRAVLVELPAKPSLPPSLSISVLALGYSRLIPINHYENRPVLASLDFLGEDCLLFSFQSPRLMHREFDARDANVTREIHAVVLSLPSGKVEAQAVWTLHDLGRYLWVLNDGHFLLRDQAMLQQGDATLSLKPAMRFPGTLSWVGLDPTQQLLATLSKDEPSSNSPPVLSSGDRSDKTPRMEPATVVRVLRRDSGAVILSGKVSGSNPPIINSQGNLQIRPGKGGKWLLNLNRFNEGASVALARFDSLCPPSASFASDDEILLATCIGLDHRIFPLSALDTSGRRLWAIEDIKGIVCPQFTMAPNGLRFARESSASDHSAWGYWPCATGVEPASGQLIQVFDAATGKIALEAPAIPALAGGGNVSFSPSGRRVAVLNDGSIQIFDLPAPPPMSRHKHRRGELPDGR